MHFGRNETYHPGSSSIIYVESAKMFRVQKVKLARGGKQAGQSDLLMVLRCWA